MAGRHFNYTRSQISEYTRSEMIKLRDFADAEIYRTRDLALETRDRKTEPQASLRILRIRIAAGFSAACSVSRLGVNECNSWRALQKHPR